MPQIQKKQSTTPPVSAPGANNKATSQKTEKKPADMKYFSSWADLKQADEKILKSQTEISPDLKKQVYSILSKKKGKISVFDYNSPKYGPVSADPSLWLVDSKSLKAKKGDLQINIQSPDRKIQGRVLIEQNTGKIIENSNDTHYGDENPITQVPKDLIDEVLKETVRRK